MQSNLFKRGKINPKYKERWFVLEEKNLQLKYYANGPNEVDFPVKSPELRGIIYVSEVHAIKTSLKNGITSPFVTLNCKNTSDHKYSFELITSSRTYVLATNNLDICTEWINELSRVIFGEILYEGVLRKLGRKFKSWRVRYCVLNKYNQIKYYSSESRCNLLGTININGETVVICDDNRTYKLELKHTFEIATKDRIWKVCAPTKEEKDKWIKCITCVIDNTNNMKKQNKYHRTYSSQNPVELTQSKTKLVEEDDIYVYSIENEDIWKCDLNDTDDGFYQDEHWVTL